MRVLVTGDRAWTDRNRLMAVLETIHEQHPISVLIEGCASGADKMAGNHGLDGQGGLPGWAWLANVLGAHYPAHWHHDTECGGWPVCRRMVGGPAGPLRNTQMLVEGKPDLVVAFHNDLEHSKGTRNMINQARKAGIPVRLFTSDSEVLFELTLDMFR